MSSRGKVGVGLIGIIAVVLGIALGRTCGHASPIIVDAGVVAVAPRIVDAGVNIVDAGEVALAVVDAGPAIPLVALAPEHAPRQAHASHASKPRDEEKAKPAAKPDQPSEKVAEKAPEVHDAGVVVAAAVVDAGSAPVPPKPLREDMKPDAMPTAPVTVTFTDQLSAWLRLTQLRVFVDGKRVTDQHNEAGIAATAATTVWSGSLFPGAHQIRVETVYFGKSNGLFSYMEGYRFRVPAMEVVQLVDGKSTRVDAVAFDKGALQQWENRPGMRMTVAAQ
jgi:hypothetical protein